MQNDDEKHRLPKSADITPYLGARSRLSQVWFNRWTVLLLLIVVRIVLASISLNNDLDGAKDKALSACQSVESMGTAMASMPYYMATGVNEMTAKSIETGVRALEKMLLLTLKGVQEIVVFYINLYISTYVCLITLAINGAAGVVVDALKEITTVKPVMFTVLLAICAVSITSCTPTSEARAVPMVTTA